METEDVSKCDSWLGSLPSRECFLLVNEQTSGLS